MLSLIGDRPPTKTIKEAVSSLPLSSNNSTVGECPNRAARCSGPTPPHSDVTRPETLKTMRRVPDFYLSGQYYH